MSISAINVLLKNISGQYLIPYIPPATASVNGLVKIGNGINVDTNGVISIESNITNSINSLQSQITSLSNAVNLTINKRRPNWNAGLILATGTRHTIGSDGWILFRNNGVDKSTWYINENIIGWNSGMVNYWQDCNSCLCPVYSGNTAMTTCGLIQFFPVL